MKNTNKSANPQHRSFNILSIDHCYFYMCWPSTVNNVVEFPTRCSV